jgi:hypothetical protein
VKPGTKRSLVRWLLAAVLVVLVIVVAWKFLPEEQGPPRDANVPDANVPDANAIDANAADANAATAPSPGATQPAPPADWEVLKLRKLPAAEALAAAEKGHQLLAQNRLAEGRAELSRAVLSDALPAEKAQAARKTLTDLGDRMLFSRRVFDGDAYAMQYTFQPREVLAKVERKLRLHVPTQVLLKINGIRDARSIRAGQTLKVLLGPFHAIVCKGDFTMDVYLHREGSEPVFVKRMRVGLGKDGTTPLGLWRVALGKKLVRAPWNPPPNSPIRTSIAWGQADYPLGKKGYWLGLEGIDQETRMHTGYGLHGTDDPASIGREESLGCIRLADADIELVFSLLYEKWSTVRVRP